MRLHRVLLCAVQSLAETYHGVYINVVYEIVCTLARGGFKKDMVADIEYIVEVPVSAVMPHRGRQVF